MHDRRVVNRWDGGVGWMAYPDEFMQRTSHALVGEEGVWLVDPLDMDGLDEILGSYGSVAGVVVTLDRHTRDAAALASRYGVAIHTPEALMSAIESIAVPITTTDRFEDDTGFETIPVVSLPGWREYALFDADGETLICADAIGSAPYFLGPNQDLGVHPFLRARPPRSQLGSIMAERVLTGHGPGVQEHGTIALHEALAHARKHAPRVYGQILAQAPRRLIGY